MNDITATIGLVGLKHLDEPWPEEKKSATDTGEIWLIVQK